jgi:1-phosphofructokinase
MITTVTPNPSLDRTLHVARFAPGHVNRATDTMVEPSGKGVNVALALHGAGVPVRAVLPVGGSAGHEIAVLLDGFGLEHIAVPIAGAVRSNISLVEADGRSTKVNEPGPDLSAADLAQPLHGTAPARHVVNTVGAGDAFLAGWLAAVHAGATNADALANSLRFGATAVEHEGTLLAVPDPRRPVSVVPAAAATPLNP